MNLNEECEGRYYIDEGEIKKYNGKENFNNRLHNNQKLYIPTKQHPRFNVLASSHQLHNYAKDIFHPIQENSDKDFPQPHLSNDSNDSEDTLEFFIKSSADDELHKHYSLLHHQLESSRKFFEQLFRLFEDTAMDGSSSFRTKNNGSVSESLQYLFKQLNFHNQVIHKRIIDQINLIHSKTNQNAILFHGNNKVLINDILSFDSVENDSIYPLLCVKALSDGCKVQNEILNTIETAETSIENLLTNRFQETNEGLTLELQHSKDVFLNNKMKLLHSLQIHVFQMNGNVFLDKMIEIIKFHRQWVSSPISLYLQRVYVTCFLLYILTSIERKESLPSEINLIVEKLLLMCKEKEESFEVSTIEKFVSMLFEEFSIAKITPLVTFPRSQKESKGVARNIPQSIPKRSEINDKKESDLEQKNETKLGYPFVKSKGRKKTFCLWEEIMQAISIFEQFLRKNKDNYSTIFASVENFYCQQAPCKEILGHQQLLIFTGTLVHILTPILASCLSHHQLSSKEFDSQLEAFTLIDTSHLLNGNSAAFIGANRSTLSPINNVQSKEEIGSGLQKYFYQRDMDYICCMPSMLQLNYLFQQIGEGSALCDELLSSWKHFWVSEEWQRGEKYSQVISPIFGNNKDRTSFSLHSIHHIFSSYKSTHSGFYNGLRQTVNNSSTQLAKKKALEGFMCLLFPILEISSQSYSLMELTYLLQAFFQQLLSSQSKSLLSTDSSFDNLGTLSSRRQLGMCGKAEDVTTLAENGLFESRSMKTEKLSNLETSTIKVLALTKTYPTWEYACALDIFEDISSCKDWQLDAIKQLRKTAFYNVTKLREYANSLTNVQATLHNLLRRALDAGMERFEEDEQEDCLRRLLIIRQFLFYYAYKKRKKAYKTQKKAKYHISFTEYKELNNKKQSLERTRTHYIEKRKEMTLQLHYLDHNRLENDCEYVHKYIDTLLQSLEKKKESSKIIVEKNERVQELLTGLGLLDEYYQVYLTPVLSNNIKYLTSTLREGKGDTFCLITIWSSIMDFLTTFYNSSTIYETEEEKRAKSKFELIKDKLLLPIINNLSLAYSNQLKLMRERFRESSADLGEIDEEMPNDYLKRGSINNNKVEDSRNKNVITRERKQLWKNALFDQYRMINATFYHQCYSPNNNEIISFKKEMTTIDQSLAKCLNIPLVLPSIGKQTLSQHLQNQEVIDILSSQLHTALTLFLQRKIKKQKWKRVLFSCSAFLALFTTVKKNNSFLSNIMSPRLSSKEVANKEDPSSLGVDTVSALTFENICLRQEDRNGDEDMICILDSNEEKEHSMNKILKSLLAALNSQTIDPLSEFINSYEYSFSSSHNAEFSTATSIRLDAIYTHIRGHMAEEKDNSDRQSYNFALHRNRVYLMKKETSVPFHSLATLLKSLPYTAFYRRILTTINKAEGDSGFYIGKDLIPSSVFVSLLKRDGINKEILSKIRCVGKRALKNEMLNKRKLRRKGELIEFYNLWPFCFYFISLSDLHNFQQRLQLEMHLLFLQIKKRALEKCVGHSKVYYGGNDNKKNKVRKEKHTTVNHDKKIKRKFERKKTVIRRNKAENKRKYVPIQKAKRKEKTKADETQIPIPRKATKTSRALKTNEKQETASLKQLYSESKVIKSKAKGESTKTNELRDPIKSQNFKPLDLKTVFENPNILEISLETEIEYYSRKNACAEWTLVINNLLLLLEKKLSPNDILRKSKVLQKSLNSVSFISFFQLLFKECTLIFQVNNFFASLKTFMDPSSSFYEGAEQLSMEFITSICWDKPLLFNLSSFLRMKLSKAASNEQKSLSLTQNTDRYLFRKVFLLRQRDVLEVLLSGFRLVKKLPSGEKTLSLFSSQQYYRPKVCMRQLFYLCYSITRFWMQKWNTVKRHKKSVEPPRRSTLLSLSDSSENSTTTDIAEINTQLGDQGGETEVRQEDINVSQVGPSSLSTKSGTQATILKPYMKSPLNLNGRGSIKIDNEENSRVLLSKKLEEQAHYYKSKGNFEGGGSATADKDMNETPLLIAANKKRVLKKKEMDEATQSQDQIETLKNNNGRIIEGLTDYQIPMKYIYQDHYSLIHKNTLEFIIPPGDVVREKESNEDGHLYLQRKFFRTLHPIPQTFTRLYRVKKPREKRRLSFSPFLPVIKNNSPFSGFTANLVPSKRVFGAKKLPLLSRLKPVYSVLAERDQREEDIKGLHCLSFPMNIPEQLPNSNDNTYLHPTSRRDNLGDVSYENSIVRNRVKGSRHIVQVTSPLSKINSAPYRRRILVYKENYLQNKDKHNTPMDLFDTTTH